MDDNIFNIQMSERSMNLDVKNATSIELIGLEITSSSVLNITEKNNELLWIKTEENMSQANMETKFPVGFYSLDDIQRTLNNDLKFKKCTISFEFKYDQIFRKIMIFKIKPPNCKIDVTLLSHWADHNLLKSLGFKEQTIIERFPASNNIPISLFPYGEYQLFCDIIDPSKNIVDGQQSKLFCNMSFPFKNTVANRKVVSRFSQINLHILDSENGEINEKFNFLFILNGE